ncbi:MAG: hypothetical protein M3276_08440, partial [Actinomycetota bacterium]|nr:hypothetical protein [Actinomycetota bacterium]
GLGRLVLVGGPAAIIPAVRVELLRAARGDCPNEPRVVADPDHHQPGALSGDVDGDGGTDVVQLAVDQGGPEGCQAFLVVVTPSRRTSVPTGSTPQPPGAGGPLPRVHGLVDIGDRPGLEVVVDLEAGASTDILGVFTMGDGELEPVTIAGERHVVALFPYGGSVGHQDTVDCTSDGDMVTASATIDDDGRFYRVERRFYRLDGAMLHLVGGDQQDVPAGDDGPPALPEPFGGPPFGGCPR